MNNAGLNGYIYDFSVDYDAISVDDIPDFLFIFNALKRVSVKYQECKIRPEILNVNSNKSFFYGYNIKVYKCSSSCNNINDPYAKLCYPDVVKNVNIKVFNVVSTNNKKDIEDGIKLVNLNLD